MTQQVKVPTETPEFDTGAPVQVPAVLPMIQLPANVLGKTAEDGPNVWASPIHMAEPDGVTSSWIWPVPVRAIQAM